MSVLTIKGLCAGIDGKAILKGIDLVIKTGEVHALMGPNGSGKSTLANVVMGSPRYEVTGGSVDLDGVDVLALPVHERARLGLFLAFQYPVEIAGLGMGKFLKRAVEARLPAGQSVNVSTFLGGVRADMDWLSFDRSFLNRSLNDGFSGGEKKRAEILQLLTLKPRFAIFDETDSGLDIDALKIVAAGIERMRGDDFGALIITHYRRILDYAVPSVVHVMYQGRIVLTGGDEIVRDLEAKGYDWIKEGYGQGDDDASFPARSDIRVEAAHV
jgi:Fe-S cluster assembly ATP-binding protein